ncbi:MAG: GNAT family N-acetyltransferase [Bacteroidales bacterium]|nr:GNAT family N-acetyltransferase [Bacteroidales bacterium]
MSTYLKAATEKDINLLFEWTNDPSVRQNSFNSAPIPFEDHQRWFHRVLNDPNTFLYILYDANIPIGQIRLDKKEDGSAVINYSISKSHRGKGYGLIIIQLINNYIIENSLPITTLIAKVKKENVASQLIFEKSGFRVSDKGDFYEYCINICNLLIINNINFLGGVILSNNRNSFALFDSLSLLYDDITIYSDPIDIDFCMNRKPSFIISYNYSHIISSDVINFYGENRMFNIHISLLPYNKGSDPNFWSFIDNTPKGVSIHTISKGLDSGSIVLQKEVFFDENKETFCTSYEKLNNLAVELFSENASKILSGQIQTKQQIGKGTYHRRSDFNNYVDGIRFSWNMNIGEFKNQI